jgi:cyclase
MRQKMFESSGDPGRTVLHAALAFLLAAASVGLARAQGNQNFDAVKVEIQPVQGNVYMLTGAGGNVTVQIGSDGVLLVDTQFAPMAPKILAAIRQLTDKPIRYIINTHVHRDHVGGNEALAKAGMPPSGSGGAEAGRGARIIGHANLLKAMSAPPTGKPGDQAASRANWPTETYTDRKTLNFNGEEIELIHTEKAHSPGDTIVFFHGSNVLSCGDVYASSRYPSYASDGSIQGMIAGLNRMIGMITPPDKQGQGGTALIPGHGRVTRQPDLVAYRDMSVTIRDRIQEMVARGLTLEQVKAANPMKEYEPVYGGNSGVSSTEFVVEEIYKDLSRKQ